MDVMQLVLYQRLLLHGPCNDIWVYCTATYRAFSYFMECPFEYALKSDHTTWNMQDIRKFNVVLGYFQISRNSNIEKSVDSARNDGVLILVINAD